MTLANLLTLEALRVALAAKQARRELETAVLFAEIALREQANKNRPACQRRAARQQLRV